MYEYHVCKVGSVNPTNCSTTPAVLKRVHGKEGMKEGGRKGGIL